MIVFDLACACGYWFEGWFHDRADYERQERAGLLQCPACGGNQVHKILSPVAFHGGGRHGAPPVSGDAPDTNRPQAEELRQAVEAFGRALKRYVEKNFEDVGPRFAETALKIHYGVDEARNIRGVASEAEEEMLRKEGVEFISIPLPRDSEGD